MAAWERRRGEARGRGQRHGYHFHGPHPGGQGFGTPSLAPSPGFAPLAAGPVNMFPAGLAPPSHPYSLPFPPAGGVGLDLMIHNGFVPSMMAGAMLPPLVQHPMAAAHRHHQQAFLPSPGLYGTPVPSVMPPSPVLPLASPMYGGMAPVPYEHPAGSLGPGSFLAGPPALPPPAPMTGFPGPSPGPLTLDLSPAQPDVRMAPIHPNEGWTHPSVPDGFVFHHGHEIFVFHLPSEWKTDLLYLHFLSFGPIAQCKVMKNRYTGHTRGFGFVTYFYREHAAEAVQMMHGFTVGDKKLKVQIKTESDDARRPDRRSHRTFFERNNAMDGGERLVPYAPFHGPLFGATAASPAWAAPTSRSSMPALAPAKSRVPRRGSAGGISGSSNATTDREDSDTLSPR